MAIPRKISRQIGERAGTLRQSDLPDFSVSRAVEIMKARLAGDPSQTGTRFTSGGSVLTPEGVTIDPAIRAEKEAGAGLALSSLRDVQKSRQETIGDPETFVGRKTQGLREGIEQAGTKLTEKLGKTGVTGEFAGQTQENFSQAAQNKINQGEMLATDDLFKLQGQFDLMEGTAADLLRSLDVNEFSQQFQARGLSIDLANALTRIEQGKAGVAAQESAQDKQQLGNIVMMGAMLSSRTFKHDMKKLDNQQILDSMMELDVEKWKYNGEDKEHIGCYAEDFNEMFGLENEKTIDVVDIVGVLMASVQALQEQIKELKGEG